jgi:hypothetical protein
MLLNKIMDYVKIILFYDVIHFLKRINQKELSEELREIGNGNFNIYLAKTEDAFSNSSQFDFVKYKTFNRYHLPEGYLSAESLGKKEYLFFEDELYIVRRLYPDMMILEDESSNFEIFNSGHFTFDFVSREMYKGSYPGDRAVDTVITRPVPAKKKSLTSYIFVAIGSVHSEG